MEILNSAKRDEHLTHAVRRNIALMKRTSGRRRLAVLAVLAPILPLLAGCGGSAHSSSIVIVKQRVPLLHGPQFLTPTRLAFNMAGSSGCPNVPTKMTVLSPHNVRIDITEEVPQGSTACPADLMVSPVVIAINPRQIDVHHTLTIHFYSPPNTPDVVTVPPL